MLLIVTNRSDLACDYLILRARERGIEFRRLNTERLGAEFDADISIDNESVDLQLQWCDGSVSHLRDISAVYFRQPMLPDLSRAVIEEHQKFADQECLELLRSMWRVIPESRWLNHPRRLWLAGNKPEQLQAAKEVGFLVPNTLITVRPRSTTNFIRANGGRLAAKSLKNGFHISEGITRFATTQLITEDDMLALDSCARVPMILQSFIDKQIDLRVTVVGERVYPTAIYSQEYDATSIDWRVWDVADIDLRHESIDLPASITAMCRKMTAHFGLGYSAIDLVLGKDGDYYFLELNPNGQWAWIEQLTGAPIRDGILDYLVGGLSVVNSRYS